MPADSTNLVMLFIACGGLTAALYAHALWQKRRTSPATTAGNGRAPSPTVDGEKPSDSPCVSWLSRAVMIVVCGIGLVLLLPIAASLTAGPSGASQQPEAFIRTLVFLLPLVASVLYLRRAARSDLE